MSIRTKSPTEWELCTPRGDFNDYQSIIATADGLEIDGDTLYWDQIDEARAMLKSEDQDTK